MVLARSSLVCLAIALIACNPLSAMELANCVLAVREPTVEPDGHHSKSPCGGSAVLIASDLALTLAEVVGPDVQSVELALPSGGHMQAKVLRRGPATGAVLLQLAATDPNLQPALLADSSQVHVGATAWTAGNSFGVLEQNGVPALSRGIVSGLYVLPTDAPIVRGRGGRVLSTYHGPVIETDAAINDGNQGGPLLDNNGDVIGLVSLGLARERRLGTVVPIHLIAADLKLESPLTPYTGTTEPVTAALVTHADVCSESVALIYLERPQGLGNPKMAPRPAPITAATPSYERELLEQQWDRYYHDQQILYTDQPVTALVIDAGDGYLLTAASNLHGEAVRGRVLITGGQSIDCTLVATNAPLDLALFKSERSLPMPSAPLSHDPALACGDPIGIVGRHRPGIGYTITTGVVSAVARRREQGEFMLHQTDALANYGSLGGPVVDLSGDVVGIVTMLGPNDQWPWLINSGVALFVDSGTIDRALPQLKAGENQAVARTFGLGVKLSFDKIRNGLVIHEISPNTGAAAAGIQPDDMLLKLDGQAVASHPEVTRIILRHREGDKVLAVVRRGAEDIELTIELKVFK
jgi:serine protease DegQ